MSLSEIILAQRYSQALFELALKEKALEKVGGDLASLADLAGSNKEFERFLKSSIISRRDQENALSAMLKKAKANQLTIKFVSTLAKNRRLGALKVVVSEYEKLILAHKGEVLANIISATPLTSSQVSGIEKSIAKALGHKVKVIVQVKEEILGGLIIKIGSKMLDGSVLSKLNRLQILNKNAIASI